MQTNHSSLERIVQSPYEVNGSAEIGEYLFEYTQSLMDPERGLGSVVRKLDEGPSGPSDEAIEVFGERQAESIIETSRLISASGILYGCEWTEGVIRGVRCGRLEKDLLLMCLSDHRITRTDAFGMKHVIKDLGLWKMVFDALYRWKMEEKYPGLARCKSINSFKKKQTQSFKCIFFLARAVTCMKYLEWDFPAIADNASLKMKMNDCFGILENLVTVSQKKEAPKKVPIMKAAPVATPIANLGILDSTQENGRLMDASIAPVFAPLDHFGLNDLSHRLRSTDSRIVRFSFPSEPKEHNATRIPNISRPLGKDGLHKKRSIDKLSSCGLPKKQKPRFSHVLFDTKKSSSSTRFPENHDKGNPSAIHTNQKCIDLNKKPTAISHALFDMKNNCSQNTDERKFVDMPKMFALDTKHDLLPYVSDGSSMHSGSMDPNYWYPVDPEELILNPLQIEMAWLCEETIYCNRNTNIDWIFVMKYASPTVQIELRQIPDVIGTNCDEETLAELLFGGIEAKRFTVFRREVRRKLLQNNVRTRMQGILPRLRKATHPLRLQKMRLRKMRLQNMRLQKMAAENENASAARGHADDDLVI